MRTTTLSKPRLLRAIALVAIVGASAGASADEQKKSLEQAVAELRDNVESLASDLTFAREERNRRAQANVQATAQLRADLEAETLRDARAEKTLEALLADAPVDPDDTALATELASALGATKQAVATSIPFRQRERHAELVRIEQDLKDKKAPVVLLAQQFASFLEDEARLNRQSAIAKTEVIIDGEGTLLVEAVRIGMVSMFFRTEDGRYGRAHAGVDNAKAHLTDDADVIADIEELLLRFQKGQKTGPVVLPVSGVNP